MPNNLIAEIAKEFISGNTEDVVDIVTFVEAPWGLNIKLMPVQKFILRCFYGLPLDDTEKSISVPDVTNERVLYTFTEKGFLKWLHAEGRSNTDETEGHIFQELVLVVGRRGTKCRDRNDRISTTEGSITFGELCDRLNRGERIGIVTYDPITLKHSVSYNIKAESNNGVECFEIETKRGIKEISSWNHPYLIWREGWEKPAFVEMSKIQIGDKIASAECTRLFGKGGIGIAKAALLGCFCGDDGTTCSVDKEIPECIFRGTREEVSVFLSRLFGRYGYIKAESEKHGGVPKSYIGYCSASPKMVYGVAHLLLKFGIHCVVSKTRATYDGKNFDVWDLRIVCRNSLERFWNEINMFSQEDAVEKAVAAAHGEGDCDVFLGAMGTSDVRWDEVKRLSPVGKRDTVDVEVEGTHIIGGDLISHNSTLASCISNYELYKLVKRSDPSKYYGFPANTSIAILNVAPTDEQSGIVFDMTQSMAMRCPYMKDRSLHQTMTYFDIQTDADLKIIGKPRASLISIAGGCSSNALRGRNAIVVIMDEMAYFIDNNGRFSGSEVYRALTPSIANFRRDGKIICISSPYAKFGAFYERYVESMHERDFTLMFKMYSAMVNPTIPSEILRAARRRDRVGFMCEYGGEFSDTVTAWIDDEAEFRKCVTNETPPNRGVCDVAYYFGIDLGFKNDGTAIAVVHRDDQGKIVLDYANCWYSGSSDVWEFEDSIYRRCGKYAKLELLKMSDIAAELAEIVKWFPAKEGIFDQHNGYALAELLEAKNLKQFRMEHFSDTLISDVYQLTKRLYSEGLIKIYNHPVLVPEMLTLEAERKAGQKVIVRQPNRRGAHNDISDAFVRAVWLCYNDSKSRPVNIATGAGGVVGGSIGRNGKNGIKQETQAEFFLKKVQMHGDHPRGLYNIRGRKIPGRLTGV